MSEILATLSPSPMRRFFGTVLLGTLGVLLLYLALSGAAEASFVWRLVLVAVGVGAVTGAVVLYRGTRTGLELTASELRVKDGRVLARVEEMARVERGAFAFKPSNGFVLHLTRTGQRGWTPGLWWRMGRRLGVGGVTSAHEGKFMAEAIMQLIALRDMPPEDPADLPRG